MKASWTRFGCGLLVVALSGAFTGCGDDDDDHDHEHDAGDDGGTSGKGGSGGAGKAGAGGTGKAGAGGAAAIECSSLGDLSADCVTCIEDAVDACGDECVALLNCTADQCGAATSADEQTACVTKC